MGPVGRCKTNERIIPAMVPKIAKNMAANLYRHKLLLTFLDVPAGMAIRATVISPPTR